MIKASQIFDSMRSMLDDDHSGRYNESDDLVPAVNASIDFCVNVLNHAFAQKRIIHESLRDLVKMKHTNAVILDDVGHVELPFSDIWTVFNIDINPKKVEKEGQEFWVSGGKSAIRMSLTEWNFNRENPFSPGNVHLNNDLTRVGYVSMGEYTKEGEKSILIRPVYALNEDKDVLVWYLKNPDKVEDGDSDIEFPRSMESFIIQKAVNYISFQHGGQSPYFQFTSADLEQLVQLLMS